jgi:hypothetical protein
MNALARHQPTPLTLLGYSAPAKPVEPASLPFQARWRARRYAVWLALWQLGIYLGPLQSGRGIMEYLPIRKRKRAEDVRIPVI